jgi:hypothetical protein
MEPEYPQTLLQIYAIDRRCGSLITARDHSQAGDRVWAPDVLCSRQPDAALLRANWFKQGAEFVAGAEDAIEDLPTPILAARVRREALASMQRNLARE